jgi:calcium channel MID1
VVFNLSFCDSVAYAVPANPKTFSNITSLGEFYDNAAKSQYQFFENAIQQIPCEITSSGQYSLARTCDNCRQSYKAWLCSVMIPRCMDFSAEADWLHPRNIAQEFPNGTSLDDSTFPSFDIYKNAMFFNTSRNPLIDEQVKPGPYKEILPCDDLCYNIVQSCPAAMGFDCPRPGQLGFNHSYGLRPNASQKGALTCNYPGAAYGLSDGSSLTIPFAWILIASIAVNYFIL